jgi:hypothetical protein
MNMIKFILLFAFTTNLAFLVGAQPANYPPPARESIEWCDIWISHANETNLPRVLLIGDISDPVLLKQIEMVLDEYRFDVIHFNNGMHGWQHSEKEYGDAFQTFLAAIKTHAPNAKLIWANTTTLKVSKVLPPDDQTQASDERIAARNAIALEYIQPQGIDVDDLNTLGEGHPEYHSDNVHFNDQGIALQATQVATHIEKILNP